MPVDLTDSALAAWTAMASRYGVSLTALVEALGEALADIANDGDGAAKRAFPGIAKAARRAREIDEERRRRR